MKKRYVISLSLLALLFTWISLKYLGVVGRQFTDGTNISESFAVTSTAQTFDIEIQPTLRRIYNYDAYLIYNGENFIPDGYTQDIEVSFLETYCTSQEVFGSSKLQIHAKARGNTHTGIGRYGKVVKPNIFNRSAPICLKATIESLSQPVYPNLELNIWVGNQRACWGIECMLD